MTRLAWVLAAFWVAGLLDYLVQANWWGWPTFGIPVNSDGIKNVWWLGWLPSDPWHVWQFLRNLLWLWGAWHASRTLRDHPWWLALLITIGLYVVARGASSSLILQIVR